ncbi:SRPBCC family protein [Sinosporangium siamense]|uniref:Activator of Hsp90 ATPase homolog 1-like protein n=1 Tax=Sinosporangium siamense TaxID=1367973 RepID=A0A919RPJ5_9ACTN|nr:hypothetical protein [Sinosporangium siamense]GII97498.1 hypothetical protein Ssi02_77290 [Sinosporangium siamense]
MGSVSTRRDPERLTFTVTADYDASPEQVWRLWGDPRKLERWFKYDG